MKDKQKWNKDLCLENMYEYSKIQIFLMMKSMCSKWWTKGILIYQRNHQLRDLKVLPFGCVNGKCNFRRRKILLIVARRVSEQRIQAVTNAENVKMIRPREKQHVIGD